VEMSSNDVSLEDVFLRLTEDRAEDEEDIPGIREAEEALTEEAEVAGDETEEEEDSPYYDEPKESKASKKSKDEDDSDDYKPLFGGKQ